MKKLLAIALAIFPLSSVADSGQSYLRITNELSIAEKPHAQMTVVLASGEANVITVPSESTKPGIRLTIRPSLGDENIVKVEAGFAIDPVANATKPPPKQRTAQVTMRAKLGSSASIYIGDGITYKWTASRASDAEIAAAREKSVTKK